MTKQRVYLYLAVLFAVMAFMGVSYLLMYHIPNHREYVCLPLTLELMFVSLYKREKRKLSDE